MQSTAERVQRVKHTCLLERVRREQTVSLAYAKLAGNSLALPAIGSECYLLESSLIKRLMSRCNCSESS